MNPTDLMLGDSYFAETNRGGDVYLGVLIEKKIKDVNRVEECEYVFCQRESLEDTEKYIVCVMCQRYENALQVICSDVDLTPLHVSSEVRRNGACILKNFYLGTDVLQNNYSSTVVELIY